MLTAKQEQLINKGYDKEKVLELCDYSLEEIDYAIDTALGFILKNVTSVVNPICTFIGGQPGAGKSVMSTELKSKTNAAEISMDACRMYHPRFLEIEDYIKDFYKDKKITPENNPGDDLAAFTQDFAGNMANKLIERISDLHCNILMEWNMRNALDVLRAMSLLKSKGYTNEALVVTVNKETSLNACDLRSKVMSSYGHITRKPTPAFHQLCIDTIPKSVDEIYQNGTNNNILDKMDLVLRDGTVLWSNNKDLLPSEILNKYLNDVELTKNFNNNPRWAAISYYKESLGLNKNLTYDNEKVVNL